MTLIKTHNIKGTLERRTVKALLGVPEPPPVEECWTECVSDVDCPPGQHPEEVCTFCEESICEIICMDDYPSEPSEPQAS